MPKTKQEGLFFTITMCFLMVLCMTIYNILLHDASFFTHFSLLEFIIDFIPGFIVALLIDIFIVAPVAKKLAFKLPIDKTKNIQVILAISGCMVCGMVLFMSLFGLIAQQNFAGNIFLNYGQTVLFNFIVALPLQWLIVGPLVRQLLKVYRGKK